jgi:carbon storage regulator
MLVLTRKLMERLYIGGDICITVVRLEGSQVRLGIEAPRHVPVVRAELKRHERPAEVALEVEAERLAAAPVLATRSARLRGQAVRE